MYYGLSLLTGAIIAVMLLANGELTAALGVYSATVVIHVVGLLLVCAILLVRRERVRLFPRELPWTAFLGGVIGVATTVSNNLAFGGVSVSAIVGLGLLGQTAASLCIDQFGWLGMPRRPFFRKKLIGIAFVLAGIVLMLLPFDGSTALGIVASLLGGVTVVLSRTINAQLTEHVGPMQSTLYNYITGLATALVILLLLGRAEPMLASGAFPARPLIYTGGMMGVCTVWLLNLSVKRIPAFYMTLLLFIGQVAAGLVIDILLTGALSFTSLAGGVCITFGMALNLLFDRSSSFS